MALLGELNAVGQGIHKDETNAVALYRKAAELGSVAGQYDLAYAYARGLGVERDATNAAKWYQAAAEGGDPMAQFDLGQRYEKGLGVSSNYMEAYKWLSLAVAQGQTEAEAPLKKLKSKLTEEQLVQAVERVNSFSPRK